MADDTDSVLGVRSDNNPSAAVSGAPKAIPLTLTQILFSYRGRILRRTFWRASLCTFAASLIFIISFFHFARHDPVHPVSGMFFIFVCAVSLLLIWVTLAIQIKRWHDLGITGLAVLITVVPIVIIFLCFGISGLVSVYIIPPGISIILAIVPGSAGANKYGASPLSFFK